MRQLYQLNGQRLSKVITQQAYILTVLLLGFSSSWKYSGTKNFGGPDIFFEDDIIFFGVRGIGGRGFSFKLCCDFEKLCFKLKSLNRKLSTQVLKLNIL